MSRRFRQIWAALAAASPSEPQAELVKKVSARVAEITEALEELVEDLDEVDEDLDEDHGELSTNALLIALTRYAAHFAANETDLTGDEFVELAGAQFEEAEDEREQAES